MIMTQRACSVMIGVLCFSVLGSGCSREVIDAGAGPSAHSESEAESEAESATESATESESESESELGPEPEAEVEEKAGPGASPCRYDSEVVAMADVSALGLSGAAVRGAAELPREGVLRYVNKEETQFWWEMTAATEDAVLVVASGPAPECEHWERVYVEMSLVVVTADGALSEAAPATVSMDSREPGVLRMNHVFIDEAALGGSLEPPETLGGLPQGAFAWFSLVTAAALTPAGGLGAVRWVAEQDPDVCEAPSACSATAAVGALHFAP